MPSRPASPMDLGWLLRRLGLTGLVVASAAIAAVDYAWPLAGWLSVLLTGAETLLLLPWALLVVRLDREEQSFRGAKRRSRVRLLAAHGVNVALLVLCLVEKWLLIHEAADTGDAYVPSYRIYTAAAWVLVNVGLLGRGSRIGRWALALAERPARLSALSFGLAALVGALLLNLPPSLRHIEQASFVDGLFTAMSAVCVTGLTVGDVAQTYTPFGQAVVLLLIQAGGLGIMALSAAFAVLAGRRLRATHTAALAQIVDAESLASLRRTVLGIVVYTFAFELAGALLLYPLLLGHPDTALGPDAGRPLAGAGSTAWAAVFLSVSAFCNAGFTLFRDGVGPLSASWPICWTLMMLIVAGGLGFPVLDELRRWIQQRARKHRPRRLSLHARVVLVTTGVLLAAGAVAFLALEWDGAMAGRPVHERLLTGLFQSVTMRTAGFSTLAFDDMAAPILMLTCLFMFVGAAPGSTGGGVKTTTLAVLFAAFRAELRGRSAANLFDRRLPGPVARRAMGVFVLSLAVVSAMTFMLLVTERQEPLDIVFEAVSAFATVGLSTGITEDLSVPGRLLVTATMFVGRIGPLTMALALAARGRAPRWSHPEERVQIG